MSLGLNRTRDRNRDLFRTRDERQPLRLRDNNRVRLPGETDVYNGPRSTDLRPQTLTSDTTSRVVGGWPATGFQTTQSLGANAWGNVGGRLDTPQQIRAYIEQRQRDLPPTSQSLAQIAREVAERGGTIAIATHRGGTKQSDDAIVLADGSCIDIIGSVDSPDARWQWLHHGQSYGATYDPSRNVVDPLTGEFKTFADFCTERGLPVPPYIPLIDNGGGAELGGMDHMSGWIVDADKTKKKDELDEEPQPGKVGRHTFLKWMRDNKMPPTSESLDAFIAANPDWERDGENIRIKPEALHKYGATEEAGRWHSAFVNDENGDPTWGFEPLLPATDRREPLLVDTAALRGPIRV